MDKSTGGKKKKQKTKQKGKGGEVNFRENVSIMMKIDDQRSHKKIIDLHKQDMLINKFYKLVRDELRNKARKGWFAKARNFIKKVYRGQKPMMKLAFQNKYPIDTYIDNYWFVNCPESKSISEVNQKVYDLIHHILSKKGLDDDMDGNTGYQGDIEQGTVDTSYKAKIKIETQTKVHIEEEYSEEIHRACNLMYKKNSGIDPEEVYQER